MRFKMKMIGDIEPKMIHGQIVKRDPKLKRGAITLTAS